MNCIPEFYVDPSGGGRLTAEALLRSEGSVDFLWRSREFPKGKHCIFHIAGDDFWFNFGFIDGQLSLQRREFEIRISQDFFNSLPDNDTVIASWTLDQLTLLLGRVGFQGPSYRNFKIIEPRPAPASLLKWARQQSLLQTIEYSSEAEFVSRVHTGLAMLQDKIEEMSNRSIFWDIRYDGNLIVSRTPKKERDILAILQGLLSDQFFVSSIEVLPELTNSAGRLDFLFLGYVKAQGHVKVCAEFKLAHSVDLENGIEKQLPAYMQNQKTHNGTYCILDFEGNRQKKDLDLHPRLANAARRGWPDRLHPIKLHHFYLGNEKSASKRR